MAKHFVITINNWDEYQERADRSNYTWFKNFSKEIDGHLWLNTSNDEYRVWAFLRCKRNASEAKAMHFSEEIIAVHCKIKQKHVGTIIDRLVELGAIKCDSSENSRRNDGKIPPNADLEKRREEKKRGEESAAAPPPRKPAPPSVDQEAEQARAWAREAELDDLIEHYRKRFTEFHKSRPIIFTEDREALARLMELSETSSSDRLKRILGSYVRMEDQWFAKNGWNLRTLETDIQKISARVAA